MFVDLHVHSVFSDGCLRPDQLVQEAVRANVSFLALADHNTLSGCADMKAVCRAANIRTIDAVEIDSVFQGEDLHILSFGADPSHREFVELVGHARAMLDKMSTDLIVALQKDGKPVDLQEYDAYPEQTGRGGWKALYYIKDRCLFDTVYQVFPLYDMYGVSYAKAGFSPAQEVIRCIHAAGGLAVLAHPGDVNRRDVHIEADEMVAQIEELFSNGLDGAECYYPKHTPAETELFVSICRKNQKLITSGSDCHGEFSGKPVGFMKKTREDLNIEEIWKRSR